MQMRSFAGVWLGILGLSLVLTAGCGGPRTHYLSEHKYKALDAQSEIDVYVGTIEPPYEELAIVDSEAFAYVDDQVKQQQLDQIKRKARRLGGNAVHDVRILTKKVQGYTLDERTPFTSWASGTLRLVFHARHRAARAHRRPDRGRRDPPQGRLGGGAAGGARAH